MKKYYANDCECENLQQAICYCYDNLYDEEKVDLWNDYCSYDNNHDDLIYAMGDLDDLLSDLSPTEIIDSIRDGFNTNHWWVQNTIYGFRSSNNPDDFIIEIELLQWLDNVYTSYPEHFQIEEVDEYGVE